jgi:hypothetical protein
MKAIAEVLGPNTTEVRTDDPDAGGIMTNRGWFSFEELAAVEAIIRPDGAGSQLVHFPVRYEPHGPVYAPLGPDGHAARLAIARADAGSEERRRHDRHRAADRTAAQPRRRRWEDAP